MVTKSAILAALLLTQLPTLAQPADAPISAQRLSALISEALDRPVSLDLSGPLPAVLDQITSKTDVTLRASADVYRLLPWGEQTTVTAKIENQTLRQALTAITARLGLTFILRDSYVELIPRPALARLGKRATVDELNLLAILATTPLTAPQASRPTTVGELVTAVDSALATVDKSLVVEDRSQDVVAKSVAVNIPRSTTIEAALDSLAAVTRATWQVWGKSVLIVSKEYITREQLERTFTANFRESPVDEVVARLGQAAGLTISVEPGVYTRLPVKTVTVEAQNASVRQVLEQLSGLTGLRYLVKDEGLYVWYTGTLNPTANPDPAAAPSPTTPPDRVVLLLPAPSAGALPSGQILVTESQLPPDVAAYLRAHREKLIQALQKQMAEEGFTPPPPAQQEPLN
jgi:hypothetical protein